MTQFYVMSEDDHLFDFSDWRQKIEGHSNFCVASQWFGSARDLSGNEVEAQELFDYVVKNENGHRFLLQQEGLIEIEPSSPTFVLDNQNFIETLTKIAFGKEGAYRTEEPMLYSEREQIGVLFGLDFVAFELRPKDGEHHNAHLFSSWFYGTAWDWCFIVIWPTTHRIWMLCLSDTD